MKINRYVLKMQAKETLRETNPRPMLVTLIYLLITYGMSIAVSMVGSVPTIIATAVGSGVIPTIGFLPLFIGILTGLLGAVMQYGYTAYSLHVADREESGYGDVFSGFPQVGRVVLMNLALMGFYVVWALAVIGPAMFMIIFITTLVVAFAGQASLSVAIVFMLILYIVAIVFYALVIMRYALANQVLADDPTIKPLDAIRRSRVLMRGRSGELFVLQLSFIGWSLLAALCSIVITFVFAMAAALTGSLLLTPLAMILGLLSMIPIMLWLQPYMSTTVALYYRTLSPRPQETGSEELPEPQTPWRPDGE